MNDSESADETTIVLRGRKITKTFGATRALVDVDIDVRKGQVLCLVGENGAGKSTLGKIIAGLQAADSGTLTLHGQPLTHLNPRSAMEYGIAMVSQEEDVVTTLSVAENVFLGQERVHSGILDARRMQSETFELAESFNVDLDPTLPVESLSTAQKQLVQILRALQRNAEIIVFDEPTASLGLAEKEILASTIRRLASNGVAIIYVSHFIEEVLQIADRVLILKDGHLVDDCPIEDVDERSMVLKMIGRDEGAFYSRHRRHNVGEVGLRLEDYSGKGVHHASLYIRRGEVVGLGGLIGAGRSELAELIFGIRDHQSGRLFLDDLDITPKSPAEAIRHGICMLTEDRHQTGLLLGHTVATNISLVRSERRNWLLRGESSFAASLIDQLRIKANGPDDDISSLSGGNQQKVLFARWLAVQDANVFILDEPTKGVDIGAKHEIYNLIENLAGKNNMVLLISSDLPELLSLSDRIIVMRDGYVVAEVNAREADEEILMKEFTGVRTAA